MATKFYLHHTTTGLPSGTLPNTEQSTLTPNDNFEGSLTTNRLMNQTIGAGQQQLTNASISSTAQQIYYVTRWVSQKLKVTSIDANSWTLNFAASESDNRANFPVGGNNQPLHINAYVWRTSTGQKVGTILDGNTDSVFSEPAGTDERVKHGTFSGSAVSGITIDDDVIVFELWAVVTQQKAASYTQTVYYDGTTENTTPDALVSNHAGFIETPQNELMGDTTPPTVQSTNPDNGATDVAITSTIAITFSEAMDPATINTTNITVADGGTVAGSWAMSGGNTIATFTPSSNLVAATTYTVTVSTNVKDVAGNSIASQYQFSFTTIVTVALNYNKRIMTAAFDQTGGDSETKAFLGLIIEDTITPGGDTNTQLSIGASATDRAKWITAAWHPNTVDWSNGIYVWRYRVTTANANLAITEVILRRLSNDCQTVKASKSSGAINVSLGSTGLKSGNVTWNDGTQNPAATKSANDRFEIVFRITNSAGTIQVTNVGLEHTTTGNDNVGVPFTETAETATNPTGFCKTVTWQAPPSGNLGIKTISVPGAGRIKGVMAIVGNTTNNTGVYQDVFSIGIGFADGNRNHIAQSTWGADNVSTTNEPHRRYEALVLANDSTGPILEANIVELGIDEFKIDLVDNDVGEFFVHFIVFCGSDLQYGYCNNYLYPSSIATGNLALNYIIPFQSDFIMFNPIRSSSINSGSGDGRMGFGFAQSSLKRGALILSTNSGDIAGLNGIRQQRTDRCFIMPGGNASRESDADFVSFNPAGITINVVDPESNIDASRLGLIAFKGGTWDCGAFNVSAGTGSQQVNSNVIDFAAKGLINASVGNVSSNSDTLIDHSRMCFGIADSDTTEKYITAGTKDAANPTETQTASGTGSIMRIATEAATASSSTTEVELGISSINSGNVVYNKSVNTGNLGTIEILWIALGVAEAGLTRISKQVTLVWNNNERVSKANNIKWNNTQRISKQATILWHNSIRISKLVSIIWNNSERISKLIDIRWNNTQQISKLTSLLWINRVIISKQNSIIWNNQITISKVIDLRWNNNARISKLIDLRWNNLARLSKAVSIVWDNLTRMSKQNSIVWNNNERLSKLTSLVWNNNNRISKLVDLRWNNNARISKSVSIVWNNFAYISKTISLLWNNDERISKVISLLWNNNARISKAITLQWHNIARISKSVELQWHNYQRISKQVSLIWINIARVSKQISLIWNNASGGVERISKQVTLIWDNTARVSKSSELRWNNYDRISKQISFVWHNIARLSKTTTLQWNNESRISKSVSLVWNNIQRISKVSTIQWNNKVTISKPVTIQWNNNERISKEIQLVWNNLTRLSKPVSLIWSNYARITKQITIRYNNRIKISKPVYIVWHNYQRISKTVILVWTNYERISKQNILIWNNFIAGVNRISKQVTLVWNNKARISKTTILRWNNLARISKYVRLLWNNLPPEYRDKYPHLKGRHKSIRDYMRTSNMPNWSSWLYKTR